MILDTNALSAAADSDPGMLLVLNRADEVVIPVVVLGEYRYGISQSRQRAGYESWLAAMLVDCTVLDVNQETTQHYADISLELKRIGRPIPTNDLWIAALCRQHALTIVSRDRHFDSVAGNKRIDW
jgi:tRNA(fMet)-specific endonuclease VapC